MLYQDHDHASGAAQGSATTAAAATAAAAAHTDPHAAVPVAPTGNNSVSAAAAPAVAPAPLSTHGKAVIAKAVVAHNEPVLVGKVVSAETSVTREARSKDVTQGKSGSNGDDDAAAARSASSSSVATSNSFVGDVDKTELLFDFGRYVGQVDPLTGLRDGEGCLHYKSGNVYTGHWRDGAADGFGEKRYKNGDIYRGHWDQGKRAGRGAYLFAQGHFYDGMYANDQPEGYGIYTTLKGDRYAGQWRAGHKNGKGRETLVNGQVFVGNWRNGKKQGRGKLYLPGAEGYIYGIWNNDKFFRELTANEMGVDGKEDVVDEFGMPRDASAPPVTPPWLKPAPAGARVTDRVLMGVTALEDRMESLGKALERVMGGSNAEGVTGSTDTAAAAASGAGGATLRPAGVAAPPPRLLFASPTQPTADGLVASDQDGEREQGEEGERGEPAMRVEPRRSARNASATPSAAVLSTADEEMKEQSEAAADLTVLPPTATATAAHVREREAPSPQH
jgi:hypothetical protein